jgi:hypothetical protein
MFSGGIVSCSRKLETEIGVGSFDMDYNTVAAFVGLYVVGVLIHRQIDHQAGMIRSKLRYLEESSDRLAGQITLLRHEIEELKKAVTRL